MVTMVPNADDVAQLTPNHTMNMQTPDPIKII